MKYASTTKNFWNHPNFEKKTTFRLFGEKLEIVAAPEPTDIIWEKLSKTQE